MSRTDPARRQRRRPHLLGARAYNPAVGRLLTVDPVFQAGDLNQMGSYIHSADNLTSGSGPTGLTWLRDAVGNLGAAVDGFTDAFIGPIWEAGGTFVQDMGDGMKKLTCLGNPFCSPSQHRPYKNDHPTAALLHMNQNSPCYKGSW
ncbi:hypothetical protein [Kitasatospora sp. NPDC094011]|uniref:hypothetical protein n=1 Tax=Kitasatospora sp. NPDC094011 TaxID=3364090 RepID=UPI003828E767